MAPPRNPPAQVIPNFPGQTGQQQAGGALIDPEDFEEQPETDEDRIGSIFDAVNGAQSAQIMVYRITAQGKEFCSQYTPVEFEENNLMLLRDSWGGGKYEIVLRGRREGSTRVAILKRAIVTIAAPIAGASTIAPAQQNEMGRIFEAVIAGQKQTQDLIVQIANRPQVDPQAQFAQSLDLMVKFKTIFGGDGGNGKKSDILETVEAIRSLREISGEINGTGNADKTDTPESLFVLAKPLIDLASEALRNRNGQPAQPMAAHPTARRTNPASLPAPETTAGKPAESESDMNIAGLGLKAFFFYIITMARAGVTPDGAVIPESLEEPAKYVLAKAPEEMLEILDTPTWWEFLSQDPEAAAALAPHKAWLTALRERVLALLDGPETPQA